MTFVGIFITIWLIIIMWMMIWLIIQIKCINKIIYICLFSNSNKIYILHTLANASVAVNNLSLF